MAENTDKSCSRPRYRAVSVVLQFVGQFVVATAARVVASWINGNEPHHL